MAKLRNFPDPATATEAKSRAQFRAVREQVKAYAHEVAQAHFPAA